MTRVSRTEPAAAGILSREIRISAARNETEPFQVVVSASTEDLKSGSVAVKPLVGLNGSEISDIQIFYQHYVNVVRPTEQSPYPPGKHPDPLVPVQPNAPIFQPVTEIPDAERINQPFWIDVRIPNDAKPGLYHGEFTFRANDVEKSIPILLTVWDFALPKQPTLQTLFGLEGPRLAKNYDVELGTKRGNRILRAFEDCLADHQLTPEGFHGTLNVFDSETERVSLRLESQPEIGNAQDVYQHFVEGKGLSSVVIPMWPEWPYDDALGKDRRKAQRYIADHVLQLRNHGWDSGVLAQCGYIDEPRSKKDYERVRQWGQFYNEIEEQYGIEIPMFMTEQPQTENAKWGTLEGYVDVWVTYVGDLWDDMHGDKTRKVAERRAAGDQIWLYTGLVTSPHSWEKQNGNPEVLREGNPPAWQIDFPPMNHRVLTWMAPIYDATGLLYWATIDFRDGIDPWKRADNFILDDKYHYNGDGQFIYYGFEETVGFDGPIASMRLKWLRESMEDHAYISLLLQQGDREFALSQINRIVRNVGDWDDNSTELFAARRAMAERIASNDS